MHQKQNAAKNMFFLNMKLTVLKRIKMQFLYIYMKLPILSASSITPKNIQKSKQNEKI
jgi:hypothetical protein